MSVKEINPSQAKELLDSGEGYTYVDVRSKPEFLNGHPEGAVNIPIAHRSGGNMVANPDFLATVKSQFNEDARLLLGCQMGGRSGRAAEALAAAGFTEVANVMGGYGGSRDQLGNVLERGWLELGLPVSYGGEPDEDHNGLQES